MKTTWPGILASGVLALAAAGCNEGSLFSPRYNFSGPATLIDSRDTGDHSSTDSFEQYDDAQLAALIDHSIPAIPDPSCPSPTSDTSSASNGKQVDSAINHFYHCYTQTLKTASNDPSSKAFRKDTDTTFYVARNEIQDRLLASSEQRCDAYKKYLRHLDGSEGFVAGALGTALAGAGSIVTGANTARLFSGLAGISNGIGAEAKQNIFSNLASSVIIPGIQKRRADLLQDMMKKRCHSVATYTVALAIADALKFHAACTMDVGMEESGKTLEAAQNPGLDSLAASLAKFQQVRQQMASALAPQSTSGSGSSGQASATGGTNASAAPTESAQSSMARTSTFEGITIPVDCSVDAIKQFVGMTNAATETSNAPPAGKSDPQVANAQQALNAASVYNLSVDGVLGPKTVAAIRDYQRKKNLPVTGKLDAATLGALKLS